LLHFIVFTIIARETLINIWLEVLVVPTLILAHSHRNLVIRWNVIITVVLSIILELIEHVPIVELILMLIIGVEVSILESVLWLIVHILVLELLQVSLSAEELSISLFKLTLAKLKVSQKLLILVHVVELRIVVPSSAVESHIVLLSEVVIGHPEYVSVLIELLLTILIIVKHLLLVEWVVHLCLVVEVLLHIGVKLLLRDVLESSKCYTVVVVLV
jgi:hypothetical protein